MPVPLPPCTARCPVMPPLDPASTSSMVTVPVRRAGSVQRGEEAEDFARTLSGALHGRLPRMDHGPADDSCFPAAAVRMCVVVRQQQPAAARSGSIALLLRQNRGPAPDAVSLRIFQVVPGDADEPSPPPSPADPVERPAASGCPSVHVLHSPPEIPSLRGLDSFDWALDLILANGGCTHLSFLDDSADKERAGRGTWIETPTFLASTAPLLLAGQQLVVGKLLGTAVPSLCQGDGSGFPLALGSTIVSTALVAESGAEFLPNGPWTRARHGGAFLRAAAAYLSSTGRCHLATIHRIHDHNSIVPTVSS